MGTAWEDNKHAYEHWQNPDDGLHMQLLQRPVTADAIPAVRQAFDALEALQQYPPHVQLLDSMESEQLLKRNQLLQQQKSQLQAKVSTSLQYANPAGRAVADLSIESYNKSDVVHHDR